MNVVDNNDFHFMDLVVENNIYILQMLWIIMTSLMFFMYLVVENNI